MSKRDLKLFITDLKESIEAILDYTDNMALEQFCSDRKTYSAVIREFEIIGEATKHLPQEFLGKYSNIEWRDIRDFRNMLIHEYFGVDSEIVWNVVQQDLPELKVVVESMLNEVIE